MADPGLPLDEHGRSIEGLRYPKTFPRLPPPPHHSRSPTQVPTLGAVDPVLRHSPHRVPACIRPRLPHWARQHALLPTQLVKKCIVRTQGNRAVVQGSTLTLRGARKAWVDLTQFPANVPKTLTPNPIPPKLVLLLPLAPVVEWRKLLKLEKTKSGTIALRLTIYNIPLPLLNNTPSIPAL